MLSQQIKETLQRAGSRLIQTRGAPDIIESAFNEKRAECGKIESVTDDQHQKTCLMALDRIKNSNEAWHADKTTLVAIVKREYGSCFQVVIAPPPAERPRGPNFASNKLGAVAKAGIVPGSTASERHAQDRLSAARAAGQLKPPEPKR